MILAQTNIPNHQTRGQQGRAPKGQERKEQKDAQTQTKMGEHVRAGLLLPQR